MTSTKFLFIESMDIFNTLPQYHTILEVFVVLWFAWFFTKRRYNNPTEALNGAEIQRKLREWQPEPLIPDPPEKHQSLSPRYVTSKAGKRITVNGHDCLNLGTHNYLGLVESKEIEEKAAKTVEKYGVGSCGPRGFYGTVDVHLELEERLAKFTNTEEAVVYSYGFSTIASAISAYCKRRDVVFVDEKVNFAIQKGLDASRSNVKYFKHNDICDLKNLIVKQEGEMKNAKHGKKIKRFLIVEGIYMNSGTICPLPELLALCKEYKLRMFIDESISFGTLGAHGKGVTEHFAINRQEIDMIMGSLDWAVGSIGGFCVGTSFVIEHQRLSGLGYCFSASLPPLLTSAAICALDIMEKNPGMFKNLQNNCLAMNEGLKQLPHMEITSSPESPVKHLCLMSRSNLDHTDEQIFLSRISEKCIENNLAIITPVYLETEVNSPRPSLRICISALLDSKDIEFALSTLRKSIEAVIVE